MEDKEQTSEPTAEHEGPAGRRAQRREARRAEILDAAMAIVLEDGLAELAVARLAKTVGAAVGAIYRYFPSKEALLVALQEQAIEAYRVDLEACLARVSGGEGRGGALRRVRVGFGYYLEDAEREPARHRLLDIMMSAPAPVLTEEDASFVQGVLAPVLGICRALLDDAVAAGALSAGDNEQRTYVLWALLHGLDHFRKRDRLHAERLQVAALARQAMEAVLIGWGADREALGRLTWE